MGLTHAIGYHPNLDCWGSDVAIAANCLLTAGKDIEEDNPEKNLFQNNSQGKCMLGENVREEAEMGNDYLIEVNTSSDNINANAEEVAHFPSEMVKDFPGTISDEISQNLRQKLLKLNPQQKVRLALLANRATRSLLIQSPQKMISLAVLNNPKLTESEVLSYAQQRNLIEDIPLAIAKDTRWMRNYQIKLAVVSNPKTPLSVAIKFLPHLHDSELKLLSRDKDVSSILSRAAHNTLLKRTK